MLIGIILMSSLSSKMFGPLVKIRHFLSDLFARKSRSISEDIEAVPQPGDLELSSVSVTILTKEKNHNLADEPSSIGKPEKSISFWDFYPDFDPFLIYKGVFNEKWMVKKFFWCMSLYTGVIIIALVDIMGLGYSRIACSLTTNNTVGALQDVFCSVNDYECPKIMVLLLGIIHCNCMGKNDLHLLYGCVKFIWMVMHSVYMIGCIFSSDDDDCDFTIKSALTGAFTGYSWLIIHSRLIEIDRATERSKTSVTGADMEISEKSENRTTDSDRVQSNENIDSELVDTKPNCDN